jgi:polysaccharide export outer membrane protein
MKMRMKSSFTYLFAISIMVLGISACTAYKKVPYLQVEENSTDKNGKFVVPTLHRESVVRFMVDDVLFITVNVTGEQSIAAEFNLPLQPMAGGNETYISTGLGRQSYMVDKEGRIDFPILGKIKVAGYTQSELEDELKNTLRSYLTEDPVVTVRLTSFRITVLGDVNRPGIYTVDKDHINIMEVMALAGDMSIYGKRDEVQIHRVLPDGNWQRVVLDISKADVISSPYFYLQQNDLVYVVPNRSRTTGADVSSGTGLWFSLASSLFGLANMIIYIANR